ncbi:MAG: cytochrome c4 [Gammaproteobacteria bacterium]|nr:cytochrome c4 [Gammaproteobacteria bacterium]
MKNNYLVIAAGLVVLLLGRHETALGAGDVEAGKAKSVTCVACHGADGKGIGPEFPNLAGQVPGHIAKQLADYKSGEKRNNPIMAGMVAALSEQDMQDLDAYYSSLTPIYGNVSEEELTSDELETGEKLYRGGDMKLGIAACIACHGPAGHGIPPRFPRVAGQSTQYLEAQLLAFKSGQRSNDGDVMTRIAFLLSEQQIKALSKYMHAIK